MKHIVDITNGDDSYAPHVKVPIPPWEHEALEKHVEDTYLMEPRTLAVRDWPEEATKEGIALACMYGHPNDYTRKKAEAYAEEHGEVQPWTQCMATASHDAAWWGGYKRGFKEAAKMHGLEF